jgi:anthranilate synthase/phosphoribosyltransferase
MILIIDNYDSFTYNIAQQIAKLGARVEVRRNDAVSIDEIATRRSAGEIEGIVISPGPGVPDTAGVSLDVVAFADESDTPLLGICLGHQCIAQYYGAHIVRASAVAHGKTSLIRHRGAGLLGGMSRPFTATRYHSLVVDPKTVPSCLQVTASLEDGTIMGLSHPDKPIHGVQFHPESVLTAEGDLIAQAFLEVCGAIEPVLPARSTAAANTSRRVVETIPDALSIVIDGGSLTEGQAAAAMGVIMDGEGTDAQVASLITALRMKGETVDEIVGFARAMRAHANTVVTTLSGSLDIVGTGGDGLKTFNISTTSAFVIAGAGVPVAKHGNRASSSASGAADVLEALGVDIALTPAAMGRCVNELGIGFLFANVLHPSMRFAAGPRRQIAIRTVFNILGPLTNPAGAQRQLLGVYAPRLVDMMAEVAGRMGAEHVVVVHGHPGMDEASCSGSTQVGEYSKGTLSHHVLTPQQVGLPVGDPDAIHGGTPDENAIITRAILAGEQGPRRDTILLNAGMGLYAADKVSGIEEGIALARTSIDSGAALAKLEGLIALSHRLATKEHA